MNCRKNVVDVVMDEEEPGGRFNRDSGKKNTIKERVGGGKEESCFSTKSLRKIAEAYNESVSSKKNGEIPMNLPRKELIRRIRELMIDKCPSSEPGSNLDSCLLQSNPDLVKIVEESDNIPPPAPNNKLLTTKPWSTSEVIAAMKYIEKRFPQYMFIEPAPMDFDSKDSVGQCMVSELCNFNIVKVLKRGKRQFGIIFNTHPSYRPGGHWICLFCCLETGRCCFYDSYGFLPEKEIVRFMFRVRQQYEKHFGKDMTLLYNDHQNQYKNVECGTFCIFFLCEMAEHGDMSKAVRNLRDDDFIRSRRPLLFTLNIHESES
jgi:hypothetical protein